LAVFPIKKASVADAALIGSLNILTYFLFCLYFLLGIIVVLLYSIVDCSESKVDKWRFIMKQLSWIPVLSSIIIGHMICANEDKDWRRSWHELREAGYMFEGLARQRLDEEPFVKGAAISVRDAAVVGGLASVGPLLCNSRRTRLFFCLGGLASAAHTAVTYGPLDSGKNEIIENYYSQRVQEKQEYFEQNDSFFGKLASKAIGSASRCLEKPMSRPVATRMAELYRNNPKEAARIARKMPKAEMQNEFLDGRVAGGVGISAIILACSMRRGAAGLHRLLFGRGH
jgi:hypothetical protein